jgi:MFS family permease
LFRDKQFLRSETRACFGSADLDILSFSSIVMSASLATDGQSAHSDDAAQPLRELQGQQVEADGQAHAEAPLSLWKRNGRLVYGTNFLHVTMMTLCMGGVWDIFLYDVSKHQRILQADPIVIGFGADRPDPSIIDTSSSFELTFWIKPSSQRAKVPLGCSWTFTCAASIVHVTNGVGNGDCCNVGNRVPALFFFENTTQLHVTMDSPGQSTNPDRFVYDNSQRCYSKGELPVEKWSGVKIKQSPKEQSKGRYSVADQASGALVLFVDGKVACVINATRTHPAPQITGAKLFLGSIFGDGMTDLHRPANAEIRDLRYGKPASNFFVGTVNSAMGLAAVLFMYPIGWLGDFTNRYTLLRYNMFIGATAGAILAAAVFLMNPFLLVTGVLIFSAYQQCLSSTIYTVLTDNKVRGERRRASVNYKTISALAMAFGPALQLAVLVAGPAPDAWTKEAFDLLLLPGWVMLPLVAVAVCAITPVGARFSSVPNADEGAALMPEQQQQLQQEVSLQARTPRRLSSDSSSPMGRSRSKADANRIQDEWLDQKVIGSLKRRFVVALSAQIFFIGTLLANGMTVRYFSLYYTQVLKFTPTSLCILNVICRLWIAGFVKAVSPLAKCVGRTNLCLCLHLLSAFFTLGIYGGGFFNVPPLWLSCGSYLLRYGFLQARDPLLYSITMDIVPESQRSRWAALNSLRTLSFSGSAFIGGILADMYGYELSFLITVISLGFCTLLFLPAWIYFPRGEGRPSAFEDPPDAADLGGFGTPSAMAMRMAEENAAVSTAAPDESLKGVFIPDESSTSFVA